MFGPRHNYMRMVDKYMNKEMEKDYVKVKYQLFSITSSKRLNGKNNTPLTRFN